MKLFSRQISKRILRLHRGLTLSQLSSWAFHFIFSRVCLSDLRGHVYVMGGLCEGLLMLTTNWLHLQRSPTKKANAAHRGDLIASRVKGLVELKEPSQPGSRIINGLVFHRRCCFLIFSLSVGCTESKTCFWVFICTEIGISGTSFLSLAKNVDNEGLCAQLKEGNGRSLSVRLQTQSIAVRGWGASALKFLPMWFLNLIAI